MKIGRNDPCPCGSGRKYKNCCHDRQVAGKPPSEAREVLNELGQMIKGQSFASLEELQAFTDRFMRQRNQAPLDDFQGLSADQMHRFLHFPFDSPNLVTYAPVVAGDPKAPLLRCLACWGWPPGRKCLQPPPPSTCRA